jgi:peptide/nickel transport system substrate-binding protein
MHLRRDVRWQDGAPFSAADVVYTMHAILDPGNNVADRAFFLRIARVNAVDPDTVVFHLKAPQASFLATVGALYPVLPAHLLAHSANLATDPFGEEPVGTGPYRFVRWLRGDRLEFDANPGYFRGAPKTAHVVALVVADSNTLALALRRHDIDFAMVESSTYRNLQDVAGVTRTTEPLSDFNAYAMNEARPILADVRVRRALVAAVDRRTIARNASFGTGTPAYADLPLFMYDGRPPHGWVTADPAAADALLDAAGWKPGPDGIRVKNGTPLRLELIGYGGSASAEDVAVQVQQMLRNVGVDVVYKSFAPALYFAPASAGGPVMKGDYDLALFSFVNGSDPGNAEIYSCASRIPAGFNAANYCSPDMERLQAASDRAYDVARRNRIVAQIEALAVHDAVYLFLYHTPYRFAYNPGLERTPASLMDRWYDLRAWTLAAGSP